MSTAKTTSCATHACPIEEGISLVGIFHTKGEEGTRATLASPDYDFNQKRFRCSTSMLCPDLLQAHDRLLVF